jgi:hypothetical protein
MDDGATIGSESNTTVWHLQLLKNLKAPIGAWYVLSKTHAVYSPAPEVLLYCDDDSVIVAPFYVMNPEVEKISAWMHQHMPATSGVSLTTMTTNTTMWCSIRTT